jgi:NAD(P)-dependent dehydrogenase (short-subunit alcohol dehydrogenase family)
MSRCATSRSKQWRDQAVKREVERLPQGLRVTTHIADVSIEEQLQRFRDELIEQQATDKIHLLFNNAGIGAARQPVHQHPRRVEGTFNICWGGVYLGVRTSCRCLEGRRGPHVNTSSVNGFWLRRHGVSHTPLSRQIRGEGFLPKR